MLSATVSVEDLDDDYTTDSVEDINVASFAYENTSTTDNGTACSALYSNSGSSGVVAAADGGQDSDSSLVYENAADGTGPFSISTVAIHNRVQYISVGYYDTKKMAERSLDQLNHFVYSYKTRYVSTFRVGKEFECRSHKDCHHRIKLITHQAGEVGEKYRVLQKGEHTGTVVNLTTKGISLILKTEVDALLKLGMTAGRVRNMLLFEYLRDPAMPALVPETKKMENRKAYLKRLAGDGREISKFVALTNWTAGKLCQGRVEFYRVDETNGADMNELIVLDEFEHLVTVEGVSVASLGVVVTSRALFRNVERAVHDQGDSLVLSTDGTYRIHFGGWTLVDCGGISVERSGTRCVQRFRPWIYMFVKTESIIAYEHMFRALVKYAKTFLILDLKVHSASIDHADAIAPALELVWPHIEILSCWEHFLRQSRKQTKLEKPRDS